MRFVQSSLRLEEVVHVQGPGLAQVLDLLWIQILECNLSQIKIGSRRYFGKKVGLGVEFSFEKHVQIESQRYFGGNVSLEPEFNASSNTFRSSARGTSAEK